MCQSSANDSTAENNGNSTITEPIVTTTNCNEPIPSTLVHEPASSIKLRTLHKNLSLAPELETLDSAHREEHETYKVLTRDNLACDESITSTIAYIPRIRWPDFMVQTFLHGGALYGIYLLFYVKFYTLLWLIVMIWASGIGITAGAHRLWSHKSYKASLMLRILLIFLFTIAGQRDAYTWALDHRIHHKFTETDADPHNVNRGFFFAHVGWVFMTAHPKVAEKRRVIDMSDLEGDAVVMFQKRWFIPLFALITIGLPVAVPIYLWQEDIWTSFWISFVLRFTTTLNIAYLVNSLAHMWGPRPYEKNVRSVESRFVALLALGEGWHNYHHVFPWDYKTGEFGASLLNPTTAFIDLCAKMGLAWARKFVSPDMILRRAKKCGDGTRFPSNNHSHHHDGLQYWGYGDRDICKEDQLELRQMQD